MQFSLRCGLGIKINDKQWFEGFDHIQINSYMHNHPWNINDFFVDLILRRLKAETRKPVDSLHMRYIEIQKKRY